MGDGIVPSIFSLTPFPLKELSLKEANFTTSVVCCHEKESQRNILYTEIQCFSTHALLLLHGTILIWQINVDYNHLRVFFSTSSLCSCLYFSASHKTPFLRFVLLSCLETTLLIVNKHTWTVIFSGSLSFLILITKFMAGKYFNTCTDPMFFNLAQCSLSILIFLHCIWPFGYHFSFL